MINSSDSICADPGPAPPGQRNVTQLAVPFRNVSAADLSWTLDGPDEKPLQTRILVVGGLSVEVRILGASHQILVQDGPTAILRETVACRDGVPGRLPQVEERRLPGGYHYEVRCDLRRYAADVFPCWVRALTEYADRPTGTAALFPDVPGAVTAVLVERLPTSLDGMLWRTWHTYPGAAGSAYGEVVATRTVLHRTTPL